LTILTERKKGSNSDSGALSDAALQTGAIPVNSDAYAVTPDSTVLDRVYDVKGLANMHVEIENTNVTNGLVYKIEKARKEFTEVSELVDADFDQDILGNTIVPIVVAATGTVTLVSVSSGDTVTINGLVYTAVAGAKSDNTEFSVDGSDTVDAADLVDSITNDTRIGFLKNVTATNTAGVVTLTSTAIGAAGNLVTLVSSNGTRLAVSGSIFSGGIDNFDIRDIENISPESTAIRIRVKRQTAGQNATLAGFVSVN